MSNFNRCWNPCSGGNNGGNCGGNGISIADIIRAIQRIINGAAEANENTFQPTLELTRERTLQPTLELTRERTFQPTLELTRERTFQPTLELTRERTLQPTLELTRERTLEGTFAPTFAPTLALVFVPGGGVAGTALGADAIGAAVNGIANVAGSAIGGFNDTACDRVTPLQSRTVVPENLIPSFMALFNKVRAFANENGEDGVNPSLVNEFLNLMELSSKK